MVTHYRYEARVTRGETEYEVAMRLRKRALDTYDDIIMSRSWYIYDKHDSPIAIFTFTRASDYDPHWEHQKSRGTWEGRHKGLEKMATEEE